MGVHARLITHITIHHPPQSPQIKRNMCVHVPSTPPQHNSTPHVFHNIHVRSYTRTNEYLIAYKRAPLVRLKHVLSCTCFPLLLNNLTKQTKGLGSWAHNLLRGDVPSIEPLEDLLFVC